MILVLGIRRALTSAGPYQLEPWEYSVFMDFHSQVSFDDAQNLARYGGTVLDPSGISADATLRFRLDEDVELTETSITGLGDPSAIRVYSGVRDDPFILPRFFGTNIVAIVLSIPLSAFPEEQESVLLWGTTSEVESGDQIDHVGRSNRTQLGRFDFLNTIPPSGHVEAIHETEESRDRIGGVLAKYAPPLADLWNAVFAIRHYDQVPDVMIYTTRFPPGYPNGRQLTDDVALLSCEVGDCLLLESAFNDSEDWPRRTVNDRPFLDEFPFLAEAWPPKPPEPVESGSCLVPIIIVLVVVLLLFWLAVRWCRKRARRS
jgi:hypothetical protein